MTRMLVLDFTGTTGLARGLVEEVLGRGDAAVLPPTTLLGDLLRHKPVPKCSHLVVVGSPPMDAIGYGVVPFLAVTLRTRTVTLLDTRSRMATSKSLARYVGTSAPFAAGQLLVSGLAVAVQVAAARASLLAADSGRPPGHGLRRMLYLRPSVGVPTPVGGSVTHAHGMLEGLRTLGV